MRASKLAYWNSIHAMLVSFPIVCFVGALITDFTYYSTSDIFWKDCSAWLIAVGLVLTGLMLLAGLIGFIGSRVTRTRTETWVHILGCLLVFLLSLWNEFIHSRDAWTSVVPGGLFLSTVVAPLMVLTSWIGLLLIYRKSAWTPD